MREYKKVFKRRDLQRKSVMVKKTTVDMSSRKRVCSSWCVRVDTKKEEKDVQQIWFIKDKDEMLK